jgi:MFS family permease
LFAVGSSIPAFIIGGYLADNMGLHFPFIVATLMSVVALASCFGLTGIHSGATSTSKAIAAVDDENIMMPFRSVILIFGAISLLSGLANGMLMPLNRLYPINQLHVNATELGLAFSFGIAFVTALVQVPGGRLADRFGRKPLMLFSLLGAPFVVALAYTGSLFEFIVVVGGLEAFGNIGAPAYYAWQMELVPCSNRAFVSGLTNAITGIGMFFGSFLSIWLYQSQPSIAIAFIAAALPWVFLIPPILRLKETKTGSC